jgi:hypothetical protein
VALELVENSKSLVALDFGHQNYRRENILKRIENNIEGI